MTLRSENVQSADVGYALAQFDIRTATRHIRCNSHIASHSAVPPFVLMARFGNNRSLSFVVFGVQYLVLKPHSFLKCLRQRLVFLHTDRTHQHRPACVADLTYLF